MAGSDDKFAELHRAALNMGERARGDALAEEIETLKAAAKAWADAVRKEEDESR